MKKALIVLLLALLHLGFITVKADDRPVFLRKDKNGGLWYRTPVNNGVFVMHYQLDGTFMRVNADDDSIMLLFTGNVLQMLSGKQLGELGGNDMQYRCKVVEMPVRIARWPDADAKRWGADLRTFAETSALLPPEKPHPLRAALRAPKYLFSANGDLIGIEAVQIHIEELSQI